MKPRPGVTGYWTLGELPGPRKKEMKSSTWLLVRAAFFNSLFYVYGGGGLVCIYVSVPCVCLVPAEARREGVRSPRSRVRDSCASPQGYWELNPDPLREQVLSITDPSL